LERVPRPGQFFEIAFVCTGNRFRSVLAAAVLENAVNGLPVSVTSYGTLDVGPIGPLPVAIAEARALGLDISGHVARCLPGADLSGASLVVGFEAAHVVAAIAEAQAPVEQAFVLPELLELLDAHGVEAGRDPVARATEMVARAHAKRRSQHRRRSVPEIDDPIGMSEPAQRAVAEAVRTRVRDLAVLLFKGEQAGDAAA
jgi:protein-tyrosine-phosphatase